MHQSNFYGNYSPGTAKDPSAPWNQVDLPTKEAEVYVEQILSKEAHLCEAEYDPYEEDFTDLRESYKEECETPIELINKFKSVLESGKIPYNKEYWIEQCKGWSETETTVENVGHKRI